MNFLKNPYEHFYCFGILEESGATDFLSVFFFVMVKKPYKFQKNPYEFSRENHMNFKKKPYGFFKENHMDFLIVMMVFLSSFFFVMVFLTLMREKTR